MMTQQVRRGHHTKGDEQAGPSPQGLSSCTISSAQSCCPPNCPDGVAPCCSTDYSRAKSWVVRPAPNLFHCSYRFLALQMLSTFYGAAAYRIICGSQRLEILMFFELPSWWFLCRRVPHQSTVPWSVGGLLLCALLTADVVSTLYGALAYRINGGSQRHHKDCVLEVGFPCIYCPTNCLKH